MASQSRSKKALSPTEESQVPIECGRDDRIGGDSADERQNLQVERKQLMTRCKRKARLKWGKGAVWISGRGCFALLAYCRDLSVSLHETRADAEADKAAIDEMGCGGRCPIPDRWRNHRIVDLSKECKQ